MKNEIKLSKTVSVCQSDKPSEELLAVLKVAVWGTPGHTRYRHLQATSRIFDVKNPFFFALKRLSNVLVTVCLAWRETELLDKKIHSFYVRYFAAHISVGSQGKRSLNRSKPSSGGVIKQFMEHVFSSGACLKDPNAEGEPSITYAYVESENEQSMHFCNYYGFRSVRTLKTVPFSRFTPRQHASVRKYVKGEEAFIVQQLQQQYAGHTMKALANLFYKDNYFVVEYDGRIVAGAQANAILWAIEDLGGWSGKILINLLPHIPYLKKLMNPKRFSFSAVEGLFVLDGFEWTIEHLLESIIAEQKNTVAMMWFDSECPVRAIVKKYCPLGLIDTLNSGSDADIIVRGEKLSENDWAALENSPAYISSFDLT